MVGTLLDEALEHVDIVRYLSRVLLDGTAEAGALFDEIAALTESTLADWEREGWVRSTDDPRMRAVLLTAWDLGVMVLADHVSRAADTSLFSREGMLRWTRVVLDIYRRGLLTDERWLQALDISAPGGGHAGGGTAPGGHGPAADRDPPREDDPQDGGTG